MKSALRDALGTTLGASVTRAERLTGGDINLAFRVQLADGRDVFVKANDRLPGEAFAVEARGLAWLAEPSALRLPKVLAISDASAPVAFLVLEYLAPEPRARDFDEVLGRGLARLHELSSADFGLDHDNFIGTLPQSNRPHGSWADFYRDERLLPQLRLATESGKLPTALRQRFDRLLDDLERWVGAPEPPARLHGDLWAGNLHPGPEGQPCLLDPACYRGHREIDLAMMRLFGGFSERVFSAYAEQRPLAAGHRERVPLYQLYPLLVHVNLFGAGYTSSVEQALNALS